MPLHLLGLLGIGAAVGGIGAATKAVSSVARKIPFVGPLIDATAQGVGHMSSALLPGLFK
ncbi:hypothetical protein [Roseateles sp.]|uniref:hypothetical protein n=1 Tax=Roseateles sp. TaxID=1971397 RepID=UPI002F4257CF